MWILIVSKTDICTFCTCVLFEICIEHQTLISILCNILQQLDHCHWSGCFQLYFSIYTQQHTLKHNSNSNIEITNFQLSRAKSKPKVLDPKIQRFWLWLTITLLGRHTTTHPLTILLQINIFLLSFHHPQPKRKIKTSISKT